MSSPTDAGADYRHAKAAVPAHRRVQADLEAELVTYLRSKRDVPRHRLYDKSGKPTDRRIADLTKQIERAAADVAWCKGLVIACGEVVKGEPFAEQKPRPQNRIDQILATIDEGLNG